MSDLALDITGDIDLKNNTPYLIDGAAAVTQEIAIRFRMFYGEWFLDTSVGVPWFRDVLVKNVSFAVVQQLLKDVILDTPGVLELLSFDFSFNSSNREASLTFKCLSDQGIIDFSQIVEIG